MLSGGQGNRAMVDGHDRGRRRGVGAPTWVGGAALVLLGVLFLLQNLGLVRLTGNWWALFILVPALVLAGTAVTRYRAAGGRLTAEVRGALTGAVLHPRHRPSGAGHALSDRLRDTHLPLHRPGQARSAW